MFIDGWNLARVTKDYLGKEVDFRKLLNYFTRNAFVLRVFYYIGEKITPEEEAVKQKRFITWLKRNGFKVVTKPVKTFINEKGEREEKANLDVDIAIDMFDLADKVDKIVLISGDGDFTKVIERIGMKGVRTQVIAYWDFGKGKVVTSTELIEAADEFIDLKDIIDEIAKT